MKKIFIILFLSSLSGLNNQSNCQNLTWAKRLGGTYMEYAGAITVDNSGNVYTTGSFTDTADFDPGTGTYNLIASSFSNIFVSKLDASGNFLWAKQMGGGDGRSIFIDAGGNVYTTGRFSGTADFDPGSGIFNLTSGGTYDVFISKLDFNGNFVWAKQIGGGHNEIANSITIDASENVYITGSFADTADFDPGTGVYNLITNLYSDIFIAKLDSSGNFLWANQMGGTGSDFGIGISLANNGNIYTTGTFYFTADFNPGVGTFNMTSAGYEDIFVVKFDNMTGVNEQNDSINQINIFPNPSIGKVMITNSNIIDKIKIINPLGQVIYQKQLNEKEFSIQLYDSGIYFIQITAGEETFVKKITVCK